MIAMLFWTSKTKDWQTNPLITNECAAIKYQVYPDANAGTHLRNYYYLYNKQSDVIGMIAEDMSPVVTYGYDAWGKLLTVSGEKKDTVGKLNPWLYVAKYNRQLRKGRGKH